MIDPTDKSADRIARMFDAIAGHYDFLNHLLSGGLDRRWRKRAIRSLRMTGCEVVLDLCTGTGDLAIEAAGDPSGARRVLGIDVAGEMLQVGLAKLRQKALDNRIALARADATCIPAADESVDAVTIAFGIRNVENLVRLCAEMQRVLKRGGRLALLEFAMPSLPGLSVVYRWYLHRVLPSIGRLVSRDRTAYSYLPASIDAFRSPAEVTDMLRRAGFVDVSTERLTMGTVILYTAARG